MACWWVEALPFWMLISCPFAHASVRKIVPPLFPHMGLFQPFRVQPFLVGGLTLATWGVIDPGACHTLCCAVRWWAKLCPICDQHVDRTLGQC